ncbi:MAG TPA: hypothetical protein V6D29_13130 [Leptolyngbyaceae cyanobacterium]
MNVEIEQASFASRCSPEYPITLAVSSEVASDEAHLTIIVMLQVDLTA